MTWPMTYTVMFAQQHPIELDDGVRTAALGAFDTLVDAIMAGQHANTPTRQHRQPTRHRGSRLGMSPRCYQPATNRINDHPKPRNQLREPDRHDPPRDLSRDRLSDHSRSVADEDRLTECLRHPAGRYDKSAMIPRALAELCESSVSDRGKPRHPPTNPRQTRRRSPAHRCGESSESCGSPSGPAGPGSANRTGLTHTAIRRAS